MQGMHRQKPAWIPQSTFSATGCHAGRRDDGSEAAQALHDGWTACTRPPPEEIAASLAKRLTAMVAVQGNLRMPDPPARHLRRRRTGIAAAARTGHRDCQPALLTAHQLRALAADNLLKALAAGYGNVATSIEMRRLAEGLARWCSTRCNAPSLRCAAASCSPTGRMPCLPQPPGSNSTKSIGRQRGSICSACTRHRAADRTPVRIDPAHRLRRSGQVRTYRTRCAARLRDAGQADSSACGTRHSSMN